MNVKEFSARIASFNNQLENIAISVQREAPLLETSAMIQERNKIQNEKQRNELGLIRVLFLGASSTGKSTLINTLSGKIIVPEVAHVSTLIPTWIGQSDNFAQQGAVVNYFEFNEQGKISDALKYRHESFDDFRCYYCYKPEAAADPERLVKPERFQNMNLDEAYLKIPTYEGLMAKYSMVLVDTLGSGASIVDDEKAKHNMRDVDVAFVLLNSAGTVDDASRNFYASTLFNNQVSKIKPEHIIFVVNKIDTAQSPAESMANCRQAIMSILNVAYGNQIPPYLYEKLCSQIIPYSALLNRIVDAGAYPFVEDAKKIYNISDIDFANPQTAEQTEQVQIVNEKVRHEARLRRLSDEDLREDGHQNDFSAVLSQVINDLFDDGTIVENHLDTPDKIAHNFIECVEKRIEAFNANTIEIDAKINKFDETKEALIEVTNKFVDDTWCIINNFPDLINDYFRINHTDIGTNIKILCDEIITSADISPEVREKYPTVSSLRALSTIDLQNIFVPEYKTYVEKLVNKISNVVSDMIFRSRVRELLEGMEISQTPYSQFYDQAIQSLNNYVANYVAKIEEINEEGTFNINTVDTTTFDKIIEDKMHYLTLQLIDVIKSNIEKMVNASMASQFKKCLEGFSSYFREIFFNDKVNHFYDKINNEARNALTDIIDKQIVQKMESDMGFIDVSMTNKINKKLYHIIDDAKNLMYDYSTEVDRELQKLVTKQAEFQNRQAFYTDYAENKVINPLNKMIKEIAEMRRSVAESQIEL